MAILHDKCLIVTHEQVYGAPQALREFLEGEETSKITFIAHPLLGHSVSYVEISTTEIHRKRHAKFKNPVFSIPAYFMQFFFTMYWSLRFAGRTDLYVGVNPLNTMPGLILRMLGRVECVVYYTIDFTPVRFSFPLLNWFYHILDKWCVKLADDVWNVSSQISKGREKLHGSQVFLANKQKVLPIGVWCDRVHRVSFQEVKCSQLLFLGHLLEKQGVQFVLKAIPHVLKKIPDFQFLIIGGGEYEQTLLELAYNLKISEHVRFMGWVKDRNILDTLMADSAAAVAVYCHEIASFTSFADPTKLKDYLSAGLPIIMTDVPFNARELEKEGCALIVSEDENSIADAVIQLMTNVVLLKKMRECAMQYIKKFDWNSLFKQRFASKINCCAIDVNIYGQYKSDFFKKLNIGFIEEKTILDIGCGDGTDSDIFINEFKLRTTAIDVYEHPNVKTIAGLTFKQGSMLNLPFEDGSFDYVFLHDVLHHIDEKEQSKECHLAGLLEAKRVLAKGGTIIIVESNRYNPISYFHMVRLHGHNHWKQSYFYKLTKDVFQLSSSRTFESHSYPWGYPIWRVYEYLMERYIPNKFHSYNVVIGSAL